MKFGVVGSALFFAVLLVVSCLIGGEFKEVNAAGRDSSEGVRTIYVTRDSKYIIDKRFNLCFYETSKNAISIPCSNFDKLYNQ